MREQKRLNSAMGPLLAQRHWHMRDGRWHKRPG